ncbi:MAG TPA: IS1182 family transposase [Terriglobia bacterium]|jgi:transposase/IS5 family transposase|nr:IS1182 family transposase [Terriglobia bacterium]
MSAHFKAVDRQSLYMFPPSVEDWLDQKHLARFIVDVVSKLDLHELKMPYSGGGSQAYHPEMLLALLFYGYATGVFSSRKLEQATYDSIAFRYIAANTHPDHDTLAVFRKRFLQQLKPLFVQILLLAKTLGFLNLGKISLDGSKVQANASKHSALSWGHAIELEQQLNQEVARLMAMAEEADSTEVPDGMDIPSELAQREQRLKAIAEAKAKLEARAAERQAAEQAEYEAKQAQRQAKAQSSGRPPRGPEPKPPEPGVRNSDQINLTDEQSRIMPASGKSFQQAYNVQAGVETESLLIVTEHVTQAVNDKREVTPTLEALDQLPEALGKAEALLADNGYYSEANVKACQAENLTPYIAAGREGHHLSLEQRWADPPPLAAEADAVEAMKHRLQTRQGRAIYGRRKCTVEPVFGIIKAVLGFRQFHLRGLEAVTGEWTLVTLAWNLKRMFSLQQQTLRTQTA